MTVENGEGAVDLFDQHDAGKMMRQRHGGQRKKTIRLGAEPVAESIGSAYKKRHVAAGLFEEPREVG